MYGKIILATGGILAGITAYSIYESSTSVMNSLIILLLLSLFVYGLSSKGMVWNSLKLLQNPSIIALLFIFSGYYIYSTYGFSFWPSTYLSTGLALIGFALGIIVYAYWNIA